MNDLPREEWDFSRSFCHAVPDEAWYYFFTYEYGREVEVMRQAHVRAKAQKKVYPFDANGNWDCVFFQERLGDATWDATLQIGSVHLNAPSGFPDTPYIKTKHRLTEKALRQLQERNFPSLEPVFLEGSGFVDADGFECWRGSIHSFCIDWNNSDTTLMEDFRQWLPRGRLSKETNRGTSEVRRLEALLKALGVYRLRRHYGSINAALKYTQTQGWSHGYFANEREWAKHNTTAKKIIDTWSHLTY